jgi:hypothetical protein
VKLSYFIRNDSGVAGEGLRIEFNIEGEAWLLPNRSDAKRQLGVIEAPRPPQAPQPTMSSYFKDIAQDYRLLQAAGPRDSVAFYWAHRPGIGEKHSALQCIDFRATRTFNDEIFILPTQESQTELQLKLHISAANMSAPVERSATVIVSYKRMEWSDPIVKDIFPEIDT